ncbi:hypothetical protein GCM10022415_29000 [Knoellia locipacati]|uniref:N-acetyltransferase domain-containing protein n=1 Tax=Knoellia locipacati TaxID=882824 RepID=A0A512T4M3_9MICO|nr:hypothetical protein [Knoellia locipacati]GEQ15139.1 hypothetical protein KLO01_31860 [Knoellia locipacati]
MHLSECGDFPSGHGALIKTANELNELHVFVLVLQDGTVAAAAEVSSGFSVPSGDDRPDLGNPPLLRMAAAALPGHGYGTTLLLTLQDLLPGLAHDGVLSTAGETVVERVGLPIHKDATPSVLAEDRAQQLAHDLLSFTQSQLNQASFLEFVALN